MGNDGMDRLDELEHRSIYILREAYVHFKKVGILWSMGKDSTVLLALCRKAFLGTIPFPVIHIDTGRKFPEMYRLIMLAIRRQDHGLPGPARPHHRL